MSAAFAGRAPAPVRIVFDGQSMNNSPAPPNNVPTFLMHGRGLPWANVSISGEGWLDLTATVTTRLFPQARNRSGCTDILIMFGGQGDMWNSLPNGQQTGAVTYQRAIDYADAARGAGFDKVLIVACPTAGPNVLGTGRPTPSESQALIDYNALILANSGGFDAVADVSVSPFDDATNATYFAIDRTHLTAVGAETAASYIAPELDMLLASL